MKTFAYRFAVVLATMLNSLLGTMVMAAASPAYPINPTLENEIFVVPQGQVLYQRTVGDTRTLSFSYNVTNDTPYDLPITKITFKGNWPNPTVLNSSTCLNITLRAHASCRIDYQAPVPTTPGAFIDKPGICFLYGKMTACLTQANPPFGVHTYPKGYLGHLAFFQGTTALSKISLTAGQIGMLTLHNTGSQPIEGYHLHIPATFASHFSGDCLSVVQLPGHGTCSLQYFIPLGALPAQFTFDIASTTADNSPYTIPVIIGKGRPLLAYSHHAIAVGLANAEKWGLFPSTTLGLASDDALTQLALNHNIIIAGTEKGLVTSQDNGKTWHYQQGMAGYSPYPKATQIVALDDVWAVGTPGGLSVSLDKGASWHTYTNQTPGFSLNPAITALALSPHQIAAGTMAGVSFSTDQGTTWHTATNTTAGFSPSNHVTTIATQANTLWVGTQNGLSMTTDGTHWQTFDDDTPGFSAYPDVTALSLNQGEVCALTLWGLSVSDDDGQYWRTYDNKAMGLASNTHLQSVNCQASLLAVGTTNNAIAISTDKGVHWHTALPGTTPGYSTSLTLNQLAIDGSLATVAVATGKGVSISYDGGATWQTLTPMTPGFLPEDNSLGLVIPLIGETTLLNALMQNARKENNL